MHQCTFSDLYTHCLHISPDTSRFFLLRVLLQHGRTCHQPSNPHLPAQLEHCHFRTPCHISTHLHPLFNNSNLFLFNSSGSRSPPYSMRTQGAGLGNDTQLVSGMEGQHKISQPNLNTLAFRTSSCHIPIHLQPRALFNDSNFFICNNSEWTHRPHTVYSRCWLGQRQSVSRRNRQKTTRIIFDDPAGVRQVHVGPECLPEDSVFG